MEGSRGALARARRQVEKATINLGNNLLHGKVRMDTDQAAKKIVHYMEGKERNWEFDNCPSPTQVARPSTGPFNTGNTSSSAQRGQSPRRVGRPSGKRPAARGREEQAGVASQSQGGRGSSSVVPPSAGTAADSSIVTTNPLASPLIPAPSSSETSAGAVTESPGTSGGSSNTDTEAVNSGSQQNDAAASDPPIRVIDDTTPVDSPPPEAPVQRPRLDSKPWRSGGPSDYSTYGPTGSVQQPTQEAGGSSSGNRPAIVRPVRPPSRVNTNRPNRTESVQDAAENSATKENGAASGEDEGETEEGRGEAEDTGRSEDGKEGGRRRRRYRYRYRYR